MYPASTIEGIIEGTQHGLHIEFLCSAHPVVCNTHLGVCGSPSGERWLSQWRVEE